MKYDFYEGDISPDKRLNVRNCKGSRKVALTVCGVSEQSHRFLRLSFIFKEVEAWRELVYSGYQDTW